MLKSIKTIIIKQANNTKQQSDSNINNPISEGREQDDQRDSKGFW